MASRLPEPTNDWPSSVEVPGRLSRGALLTLSIVVSLVLHAALLVAAPRVHLMALTQTRAEQAVETFRVQIREFEPEPKVEEESTVRSPLASRPGSIEDQFKRDSEELTPGDSPLEKPVEVADAAARIGKDVQARDYDLLPDLKVQAALDAKIVEISEADARRDIDVARQFVRPSPNRILDENVFPVLRKPEDDDRIMEPMLVIPPAGSAAGLGGDAGAAPLPPREPVTNPEPEAVAPVIVTPKGEPLEQLLLQAPVIEEARKESDYEFLDDLVEINLDAYTPPSEKEGYFRLRIEPKKSGQVRVLPKNVTFVLDASNSIPQHKLKLTADATKDVVSKLRAEDQFNIVIFRDNPTYFQPESVAATAENKKAAKAFLQDLKSRGQTDVYNAIRPVLDQAPRPGAPGVVVLMTDGRPTSGVVDGRTIINALTAENTQGNTIFAFGGGNTVNQYLLDLLAYRNRGESYVAPSIEAIPRDLPAFLEQIRDPLMVNLRANYGNIMEDEVFPKAIPDFYKGRAVTVYGRFDPKRASEFTMRLTGKSGTDKKELIFRKNLKKAETGDDAIARNWAKNKIYYLIGEMCRVGETPELLEQVRALSRQYGIRTSYDE